MKDNGSNIGKFLIVAALAGGAAYGVYLARAAKAAKALRYQLSRIQLYNLATNGNIQIRVWVDFTNLEATTLTINQLYLDIWLNFSGTQHRIATLNTNNTPITIPGYQTVSRSFDINVPWANLGVATALVLKGFITNGQANWPTEARVEGQIKAIGFTIPIDINVPFSVGDTTNDTNTNTNQNQLAA